MLRPRNNSKLACRAVSRAGGRRRETKNAKLVAALLRWFAAHARDLPWRHTRDPYAIWVSEIMLQQTQVNTVIPYWQRWMHELPTIESLARARSEKIHKLWEGLGYYARVRNLQQAARQIVAEHGGKFPDRFDDVLGLPGVGRYTAGAICSIAFNQPTPVLDGNVIRVLTRIFGIKENPREKKTTARLWRLAEDMVGRAFRCPPRRGEDTAPYRCSSLNQSLMEFGALICTARNPKCNLCPVQKLCVAFRENRVGQLPNLGQRVAATPRHFLAFIVEREGKYLVRQRPAGGVNARLWEFPNRECNSANGIAPFKLPKNSQPFCTIKHTITRYRITLEAHRPPLPGRLVAADKSSRWLKLSELDALAFTSAHRKILEHLNRCHSNGVQTKLPNHTH